MEADARKLAAEIEGLKRAVNDLQLAARLGHSSVEGRPVETYDDEGTLRQIVGLQEDGTYTTVDLNGPPPPVPAAPGVTGGAEVLTVTSYGLTADGSEWPVDFAHIEVHVGISPGFVPSVGTLVGTFPTEGGSLAVTVDPGTYYAVLVAVNTSGVPSTSSDEVSAEVFSVAVVAPTTSPAVTVTGTPNALVLRAEAVDASVQIEYHLSTTAGFTPDATTLLPGTPTPATVYVTATLPDGTVLSPDTRYYVRAVATNAAGTAPAGAEASGSLDLGAVEDVVAAEVVAGFVLTGRIQVGAAYIDAAEGIVLPQPDGTTTRFPVDGVTPATISGFLIATGITIKDNADLFGVSRLFGEFALMTGISDPKVAPAVSRTTDSVVATLNNGSTADEFWWGLCPSVTNPDQLVSVVSFFGGSFRAVDKFTGDVDPFVIDSIPDLSVVYGVTSLGGAYYVLGQVSDFSLWVYAFDSTFTFTHKWAYTEDAGSTWHPAIGNDGTSIVIARCAGPGASEGKPVVKKFNPATGALVGGFVICDRIVSKDLVGVHYGPADYGEPQIVIAPKTTKVYVFDTLGAIVQVRDWNAGGVAAHHGLTWDGTRFFGLDTDGNLWHYSLHPHNSNVTASYTWYDGDATGGTHETAESPSTAFTWPARSRLEIEARPAPDADLTDPARTDKANLVRIYAAFGANARRLQDTPPVGETMASLEVMDEASATPPATSTFNANSGAPGVIRSAAEDATGPLIEVDGTGKAHFRGDFAAPMKMQGGDTAVSLSASRAGFIDVTFPEPFPVAPAVVVTSENSNYNTAKRLVTTTGFRLDVNHIDGTSATTSVPVSWIAFVP